MTPLEDDDLLNRLYNQHLPIRLNAIEKAALNPAKYAGNVVALLRRFPEDATFVLERIGRFGESAVPHLFALLEAADSEEVRVVATLGLAHFGRIEDYATLVRAVVDRSPYQYLACRALACLRHGHVLPTLQRELLHTSPTTEWDRFISLVSAIEDLGGEITVTERERLIAHGPPLTKAMLDARKPR
jgi:hypothetical protein